MTTLKTKWFKIRLPLNLKEAYKILLENNYKPEAKNGFDIIEYSHDLLRVKFIEKIIIQETVVDPFGKENLIQTIRYSIFEFSIISFRQNDYVIKILFPPKSIKSFLNVIYGLFGFGFVITPLSFDLKVLLVTVEEILKPTQMKVTKINASGLILSETSSAKFEIKSSKHAYNDLTEAFKGKNFAIDNIKISLRLDGVDGFIEASKAGSICFSDDFEHDILLLVENLICNI